MNALPCHAPGVNESDYRAVLAERVKATRRAKYRTVDAARNAAGVARGTWEKAERGDPIKDFSLAAIERALGWEPGYAVEILNGRDPQRGSLARALGLDGGMEPQPRTKPSGFDAYLASLEDRIEDLETRVARIEEGGDEGEQAPATKPPGSGPAAPRIYPMPVDEAAREDD